jgi:DNA primase
MFIPDDKLQQVRDATDILDVVSEYVRLKKGGTNFFGLCPFHSEKSPSFSVNPGMGIFKCFGCGAGGDAIQFVMRIEHVPFVDAVRHLADKAGIDLPQEGENESAPSNETEAILHAIRFAARFFHEHLTTSSEGEQALAYLHDRTITDTSIRRFGLGLSPNGWDGLIRAAGRAGIAPEVLEMAGLAIARNGKDGHYDRFRGRLMFPILSATGKVVGFGGRILVADDRQPKYINTPETDVYHKSQVLYGLYPARRAIRAAREVYVVEGYTDVIAMHQHGIENVVAACGTSLTPDHVRIIKRYADGVVFMNDSDIAGDASNQRSVDLALDQQITPYVVELPGNEDPASFIERHGAESLREYVGNPRHKWSFVQYHLIRARQDGALSTVEGERRAFESILERIARLDSRFEQDGYLHQMAQALDKPVIHVQEEFARISKRVSKRRKSGQPSAAGRSIVSDPEKSSAQEDTEAPVVRPSKVLPEEETLLRLMLERGPSMVEFVLSNMGMDEFSEGLVRDTVETIIEAYETGSVSADAFVAGQHGEAERDLVVRIMMDRHEPSENWLRLKNIEVPRFNDDAYEAATSAMTLLKLDRIDESVREAIVRQRGVDGSGGDVRPIIEEIMALKRLRGQIARREYLDWNEAQS